MPPNGQTNPSAEERPAPPMSPSSPATQSAPSPTGQTPPAAAPPETGEQGQDVTALLKALREEREARKALERQSKAATDELAKLREATATEAEKALLAARQEEREQVTAEYQARIDAAEADRIRTLKKAAIQVAAVGRFHDVTDVVLVLGDSDAITVEEDGTVTGIDKALEALAKTKPHWVRGGVGTNHGAPAGGPGGTPSPRVDVAQLRQQAAATGRYGAL